MPLINFPNVPQYPGVPNIRRAVIGIGAISGILGKIQKYDTFGLLSKFLGQEWTILDKNGKAVIIPDSVVSLEYRGEQRVASHPVEEGSFSSYNKVAFPFDLRMRMTCNGQGQMTRDAFIAKMNDMLNSTDLYSIATPDATYQSVNLEHFDYRRESRRGVSLLTVEAWFTEIRVTATVEYTNFKQPSGAPPSNVGAVRVNTPSTQQQAAYKAKGIQ